MDLEGYTARVKQAAVDLIAAKNREIARQRAEIAALKASLGQQGFEREEPYGCPMPGACSCARKAAP